jgi:hypothetical protein
VGAAYGLVIKNNPQSHGSVLSNLSPVQPSLAGGSDEPPVFEPPDEEGGGYTPPGDDGGGYTPPEDDDGGYEPPDNRRHHKDDNPTLSTPPPSGGGTSYVPTKFSCCHKQTATFVKNWYVVDDYGKLCTMYQYITEDNDILNFPFALRPAPGGRFYVN